MVESRQQLTTCSRSKWPEQSLKPPPLKHPSTFEHLIITLEIKTDNPAVKNAPFLAANEKMSDCLDDAV